VKRMKRPRWQYALAFLIAAIGGVAIYRVANQLGEATAGSELEPDAGDA